MYHPDDDILEVETCRRNICDILLLVVVVAVVVVVGFSIDCAIC